MEIPKSSTDHWHFELKDKPILSRIKTLTQTRDTVQGGMLFQSISRCLFLSINPSERNGTVCLLCKTVGQSLSRTRVQPWLHTHTHTHRVLAPTHTAYYSDGVVGGGGGRWKEDRLFSLFPLDIVEPSALSAPLFPISWCSLYCTTIIDKPVKLGVEKCLFLRIFFKSKENIAGKLYR